jgi:flagellar biosynthesis anti-sigma factor FlgM
MRKERKAMKITNKGSADVSHTQLSKQDRIASSGREKREEGRVGRSGEAVQVSVSPAARRLQKVAALAEREAELRAEKVKKVREQVARGTYRVEPPEVAKAIVRNEVSQLLGGRARRKPE